MYLIFVYGPPASGKYTVSRRVSEMTGLPLFHNHLIVDAVGAVFPFGTENFRRLREKFWFETFEAAVASGDSLIFTYLPENTVTPNFVERVVELVKQQGGEIIFVELTLPREQQLERIANADRGRFGKLRDAELLKANFEQFEQSAASMPPPVLRIDTSQTDLDDAAKQIAALIGGDVH